jgi:hypothetical protein
MTREEVEKYYEVSGGKIISKGAFYRENVYMPHIFDRYLDGRSSRDSKGTIIVEISDEDRNIFPELGLKKKIYFTIYTGLILEINR